MKVGRDLQAPRTANPIPSPDEAFARQQHYAILDGLRGLAALMVVLFHLFEAYAHGDPQKQIINHGYLAVDFFFLLSGFVIAHVYDARWRAMSQWDFYKRRLVRLQPMVVIGSVLGAALFYFQDFAIYANVPSATLRQVLLVMMLGLVLIPTPRALDVRGWSESFPLNGVAWSLFYEYIANVLYAVVIRRLTNFALTLCVCVAAMAVFHLAVFGERGDLIGGWSSDGAGLRTGLIRVLFPFLAGILLRRAGERIRIRHAFSISAVLLTLALSLPRLGGTEHAWINGAYEAGCVILLFPLILAIGAGAEPLAGRPARLADFFGKISYPLYITHFPIIYIYTGWVAANQVPPLRGALAGTVVLIVCVLVSWLSLKVYDEPVRRWLGRRYLGPSSSWAFNPLQIVKSVLKTRSRSRVFERR